MKHTPGTMQSLQRNGRGTVHPTKFFIRNLDVIQWLAKTVSDFYLSPDHKSVEVSHLLWRVLKVLRVLFSPMEPSCSCADEGFPLFISDQTVCGWRKRY